VRLARLQRGKLRGLQGTKFGGPLVQVCQLELYQHNPSSWRKRLLDDAKVAAQYQKLFGDTPASKKGRDKKKRKRQQADGDGHVALPAASASQAGALRDSGVSSASVKDVTAEVMDALGVSGGGAKPHTRSALDQPREGSVDAADAPQRASSVKRAKGTSSKDRKKKRARSLASGGNSEARPADLSGGSPGVHLVAEASERGNGKKRKCASAAETASADTEQPASEPKAVRLRPGLKRSAESYVRGVRS